MGTKTVKGKMMLFEDLIDKYKKIAKTEHDKYRNMGTAELDSEKMNKYKYRNIIFSFQSSIKSYKISTFEDLKKLPSIVQKDIDAFGVPYYDLKMRVDYNFIKMSSHVLTKNIDSFLDYEKNKYNFKEDFRQILSIETGLYVYSLDCSVINMYKENIITFDQLLQSLKKC